MFNKNGKEGFIAIVALGIFALIMFFGILVQQTVVRTYSSVKDSSNNRDAYYAAKSAINYLNKQLDGHAAGFSTNGKVVCNYGPGNESLGNSAACSGLNYAAGADVNGHTQGKKVEIEFEVKGRSGDYEALTSAKCPGGAGGSCFSMPTKYGTAGSQCDLYVPGVANDPLNVDGNWLNLALSNDLRIDQLDYSCNWNKLTFGSNLSDRVAVPLYYDNGALNGVPNIVNVFNSSNQNRARKFLLRMRTPCLPCGEEVNGALPEGVRSCRAGGDLTMCEDRERYVLDVSNDNEIVVEWGIDGRCVVDGREQECGLVGYPDGEKISGIYKETISRANNFIIFGETRMGQATHLDNGIIKLRINNVSNLNARLTMLPSFTYPVFSLFLNHALTSNTGANIPYLEYQILTDKPIGSSRVKLEATVTVDGVSYTSVVFKEESKQLIDFAIQN